MHPSGRDSDVLYAAGKSSQVFEFSLAEDRVTRIFSLPDGSGAVAGLAVFPGPFYGQVRDEGMICLFVRIAVRKHWFQNMLVS